MKKYYAFRNIKLQIMWWTTFIKSLQNIKSKIFSHIVTNFKARNCPERDFLGGTTFCLGGSARMFVCVSATVRWKLLKMVDRNQIVFCIWTCTEYIAKQQHNGRPAECGNQGTCSGPARKVGGGSGSGQTWGKLGGQVQRVASILQLEVQRQHQRQTTTGRTTRSRARTQ